MIRILFFGRLRELLACPQLDYELPVSPFTVADLRTDLASRGTHWAEFLTSSHALVAVNQSMSDDATIITQGDEVAFFPPVTGG